MDISENEFKKLSVKDQNLIIFKNVNFVANNLRNIRFHQKVQYVMLTGLIAALGIFSEILFRHISGK